MIQSIGEPDGFPGGEPGVDPLTGEPARQGDPDPWAPSQDLRRLAFATLWATGSDPARDGLFRLLALRRDDGRWERLDVACDALAQVDRAGVDERSGAPSEDEARAVSARMAREFGVRGESVGPVVSPREALGELRAFLGGRIVVTPELATTRAWLASSAGGAGEEPRIFPLSELAGLLQPGRRANQGERLAPSLLPERDDLARHPRALDPEALRSALAILVAEALGRDEATLAVLAHGYRRAWHGLREAGLDGADRLALVLAMLEHPSLWRGDAEGLFDERLGDGRLSDAIRAHASLDDAVDAARPRWARAARVERRLETLAAIADDEHLLDADDRRRVDEIFQEHLTRLPAAGDAAGMGTPSFRPAQHALAREIAEAFGRREHLLMHAPTGTGKTLAYLVPTLLWAYRHCVRVGVATYTRALQEQAMERDVPLALELLRRAGVTGTIRVSLLKGRENYLCWRALWNETPMLAEAPAELLAWTTLALFALTDPDGDLDRFPRRAALAGLDGGREALTRLLRRTHSESGCCSLQSDRDTCGAEAARRRAERAHLVITNHAFALARREFFRHLVFDECEHLHDVAHNAFSFAVSLRALRDLLRRFHERSRSPLARLQAELVPGSEESEALAQGLDAVRRAEARISDLRRAVGEFRIWREGEERTRKPADHHSLFREYVLEQHPFDLLRAHAALCGDLNELGAALAQLSEHLESASRAGAKRQRRALDVLRAELDEALAATKAWIPRDEDGAPCFRRETFHDLEVTARGDEVLAARVLLPHEYLGSHYYPDLWGSVLVSATTWLRDGFDAQACYLGLTRAAEPRDEEQRLPTEVRTFRAPETFDYGRVLVGAPRDAPSVREKQAFLAYVVRFLGFLSERTRGRVLALFTNAEDVRQVGQELEPFLATRRIPFWYQRMEGTSKEELSELFRTTTDSVLLGLDTFWYGADFPGPTLEYLVLARLPYGVPDRYHHAQSAALGSAEQRKQIYMPRALAKFRQGFGRLMRKESDRGCVFLLDGRVNDPRHRAFLRELPLRGSLDEQGDARLARLTLGDTDRCLREALAHMDMLADVRRRGLERSFAGWRLGGGGAPPPPRRREPETPVELSPEDLPF